MIVVDDGSTDNTFESVKSKFTDPRIKIYRKGNTGASASRNFGVSVANGKYICFLDSDDAFTENKLSIIYKYKQALDSGCVLYSKILLVSQLVERIKPARGIEDGEDIFDYLFLSEGFVPTPSIVLAKELAERVSWNENMSYGDDTDYSVRLYMAGCKLKMIDEVLVVCDDGEDNNRLSLSRLSLLKVLV